MAVSRDESCGNMVGGFTHIVTEIYYIIVVVVVLVCTSGRMMGGNLLRTDIWPTANREPITSSSRDTWPQLQ